MENSGDSFPLLTRKNGKQKFPRKRKLEEEEAKEEAQTGRWLPSL
jgi:hypothetical protein